MGVGCVRIITTRFVFGAVVSVCVIWFMFLAISFNRHHPKKTILVPFNVISKHLKLVGMDRHHHHPNSGMIYVSKRRVPNGPDPIHNRKAVSSRQPPTRTRRF